MLPPPTMKHKPSGCSVTILKSDTLARPLTAAVPEPAFKRKTLAEQAAEPYNRKLAAPPNARPVSNSGKGTIARGFAASTSRAIPKNVLKNPLASAFSGSVGATGPRPAASARPKSAYGQYNGHSRSKSHHQGMRSATTMKQREEDDDEDSEPERKGVHPFHTFTNPENALNVATKALPASKPCPHSLEVFHTPMYPVPAARSVSSPSHFPSSASTVEEPTNADCDEVCSSFKALTLSNLKTDARSSQVRRRVTSGKAADSFLTPKKSRSQLPQPSPTPVRLQCFHQMLVRSPFTTPRKRAPFLNKYTNDRCPDFYDDRIEAMERDFRMFKEQMEGDVRQATGYKESIQQLQSRGMSVEHEFVHFSSTLHAHELEGQWLI